MGQILPKEKVEWLWQSNAHPWSETEESEWTRYSDVENEILEEAYRAKKSAVMLDNYRINFQRGVQISNNDQTKQRRIKRQTIGQNDLKLRESRFLSDPIASSRSFHDFIGSKRIFIDNARELLSLKPRDFWISRQNEVIDKAISGILYEGKLLGQECQAKWLMDQLNNVRNEEWEKIGQTCVYLYSLESFLYKTLNQTMRLVGDKNNEHVWKGRVETLGPFAVILASYISPYRNRSRLIGATVYRGAQLSNETIAEYRHVAESDDARRSFQTFTSCSRSREKAEQFGNVLFILNTANDDWHIQTLDIAHFSAYPDEDEVLIPPGRCFKIERIDYDSSKDKHLVYLTLFWPEEQD